MDRNGEFQLEFYLSNIKSVFEQKFKIGQSIFNNMSKVYTEHNGVIQNYMGKGHCLETLNFLGKWGAIYDSFSI